MSEGRSLYVNGRFLTQPVTGVQRFALQISQELVERRPDVTLVVPPGTRTPEWLADERVEVVGRRGGHAWEQLELPRYLRAHGSPPLVNLASTAPAFYENQIVTHHDITYVRFPASFSRRFRLLYAWMVPRFRVPAPRS